MNDTQARDEICRIGKSLFERGHAHGTAGNISMRLDDGGFLITPTDACLGFLEPAGLVRVDAQGRPADGAGRPSKTLALHRGIYAAVRPYDPQTRCIVHTHGAHSVALSLSSEGLELLPPITPYFVMKVGHVPLLRYAWPGAPEVVDEVASTIAHYGDSGRPLRAVMLQRLGPLAWHDSPAAAMAVLEELEETARLMLLAPVYPEPLPEAAIDQLRASFGARW